MSDTDMPAPVLIWPAQRARPTNARRLAATVAAALLVLAGPLTGVAGEPSAAPATGTELITAQTPWRVWMVTGTGVQRDPAAQCLARLSWNKTAPLSMESAMLSELPPVAWRRNDFDDRLWGRYGEELAHWAGLYGRDFRGNEEPAWLCLRTRFGVSEPAQAADVKATVEYIGGIVAYVNGVEVGRGHLPEGRVEPCTPASDYPVGAYTLEDGTTPLPRVTMGAQPDARWLPRYRQRVRTITVAVPARLLVKGANTLALEVHRAVVCGPAATGKNMMWWHLGIGVVKLSGSPGAGVIPYEEAAKGPRVWSAQQVDEVTDRPQPLQMLDRGLESIDARAAMLRGLTAGNPFDPVVPVRILLPRNGVGNGQTVLYDPAGLQSVSASVGDFRGPGAAVLAAKAVRVRFAAQGNLHWCDELRDHAPADAKTIPVWIEVQTPRDQTPGWYVSTLSLAANGKTFTISVQVFVTGFIAPDPKDFRSLIFAMHSPEALAKAYDVKPYSDAHFRLMDQSLVLMGQLGSDVMVVPVMVGTHMGHETGLIRWVKTASGPKPDYSLFEKYLDLYVKHCGAPKALSLYVWSAESAKEIADAYENRRIPSRESTPRRPLQVTQWDPQIGATTNLAAPTFLDEGAEAFWKPMLDGVRDIVKKRGWPERMIMLGIGSDIRPSQRTGELLRQWAPYARWHLYSHFSADGAPKDSKMIGVGGLEVGLKEAPSNCATPLEHSWQAKLDYLYIAINRGGPGTRGGPMAYRTQAMHYGRWSRLGLDFWPNASRYHTLIWGATPVWLTWRGPEGPLPTVRFQLIREGLQDFEVRMAILDSVAKLPPEQQKPYQELLADLTRRAMLWNSGPVAHLPQTELSYDWPAYVARMHAAAAELSGVKMEAKWEEPPR